ncbi:MULTISPECIES: hypothetical protein [Tabrizicola]|uniref:hypothetical protein n=1 Tax=Tabrizicola TaxID=1443919 RepID=UPI0010802E1F|nr:MULTISPECIES: hypothetical protein [Paracoccaceae]
MQHPLTLIATLGTATAALGACAPAAEVSEGRGQPVYEGVQATPLTDDLVSLTVAMRGPAGRAEVEAYGRCAAAQYALDRGYGFARQVRTIVRREGRSWVGDAVYLISPGQPQGLRTIDAAVAVAECAELGIPTV